MKTMRNLFMVLLMAVLCVACSQTDSYVNVIPKDVAVVASVDLQSLGEKASLKDYKGFIDMALLKVQKSDEALYEQLKEIVDDPLSLGLALNEPLYVFSLEGGQSGAAVMKVDDGDKVKQLVQQVLTQEGFEYQEEGDRLWISGPVAIVVTDELLLVGENRVAMEKLLEQTAGESFASTDRWDELETVAGDVKLFVAQGQLEQFKELMNQAEIAELYKALGIDVQEATQVLGLDFQPGRAVVTGKVKVSEEYGKMQEDLLDKLDGSFLKKMPANPVVWMAFNMNGEALCGLMERVLEAMPDAARNVKMEDLKPLLENIDGELAFAMNGISQGGKSGVPDLTVFAKVKDNSWEQELKKLGDAPGIAFGMAEDDVFYLTTNSEVMNEPGKDLDNSVADAAWADKADGSYCCLVVEAEPMKDLAKMFLNRREMRQAEIVLEKLESAELEAVSLTESKATIHFDNKEDNALKQLIQLVVSMNM